MRQVATSTAILLFLTTSLTAEAPRSKNSRLAALQAIVSLPNLADFPIGVTRQGTPIHAAVPTADFQERDSRLRVWLIGGVRGDDGSAESVAATVKWFYASDEAATLRQQFSLSAIPVANPDGYSAGLRDANGSGGNPAVGYPPSGAAYNSPTDPEAAYIWRQAALRAPDYVIVVADPPFAEKAAGGNLLMFNRMAPAGVGHIPTVSVAPTESLAALLARAPTSISPARREIQQRLKRTPSEVAQQLSQVYGQKLPTMIYTSAVGVMARLQYGQQSNQPEIVADVERITQPFLGEHPPLTPKSSGSDVAGHVLFTALTRATDNPQYAKFVIAAARRGFGPDGQPLAAMPGHNEMSDAVFMGCPILAQAGALSGDANYFAMAARQLRFIQKLCLREDGLYRHSPLDETAWGRGNGFPALGLALALSEMPVNEPARQILLPALRAHLAALRKHQDPSGCWHQVVDHPESYGEVTATAMITFALARATRMGWIPDAESADAIERGWAGIKMRTAVNGELIDVCTGTGKQKSLRDYYDRTAILGLDDRGGSMVFLLATEMIELERWRNEKKQP